MFGVALQVFILSYCVECLHEICKNPGLIWVRIIILEADLPPLCTRVWWLEIIGSNQYAQIQRHFLKNVILNTYFFISLYFGYGCVPLHIKISEIKSRAERNYSAFNTAPKARNAYRRRISCLRPLRVHTTITPLRVFLWEITLAISAVFSKTSRFKLYNLVIL